MPHNCLDVEALSDRCTYGVKEIALVFITVVVVVAGAIVITETEKSRLGSERTHRNYVQMHAECGCSESAASSWHGCNG